MYPCTAKKPFLPSINDLPISFAQLVKTRETKLSIDIKVIITKF